MPRRESRGITPLFVVGAWLIFSVALAAWWVIFAYRFITMMAHQGSEALANLESVQRMLIYEGISLILCLVAGGIALAYYVMREYRRNEQIRQFFAAFTHDLKTPIASVRLQAESLAEDLTNSGQKNLANRLVRETLRLELQLENSLFLANLESLSRLHIEEVRLSKILERISAAWPELELVCNQDAILAVDARAFEIILKNLANNSLFHGRATSIHFQSSRQSEGKVQLGVRDNGIGFQGDIRRAGNLFARGNAKSSSGVGLYLVKSLAAKMGGRVNFTNNEANPGFSAIFEFPGRTA